MSILIEVSKEDAEQIWQGKCPCGGELLAGSKGGLSQNAKCSVCGNEYNVPPRPWLPQRMCEERVWEECKHGLFLSPCPICSEEKALVKVRKNMKRFLLIGAGAIILLLITLTFIYYNISDRTLNITMVFVQFGILILAIIYYLKSYKFQRMLPQRIQP